MSVLQNLSIRRKLMLMIMATSGVALLLACAAMVAHDLISFRQQRVNDLSVNAEIIAANSAAALIFNDQQAAQQVLAALRVQPHVIAARIYTTDGGAFASFLRDGAPDQALPPEPRQNGHYVQGDRLILFQQVLLENEPIGTICIVSGLQEMRARLKRYLLVVAAVLLAASLIAFLISTGLQRVISEPILQLAHMAKTVSLEKNYSARAVKRSQDELGLLTDAFNEMLTQIQQRDAALSQARDELELRVVERTQELWQEIAERKLAEERIRLLAQVVESSAELIVVGDREGRITFANRAFLQAYRASEADILGHPLVKLLSPNNPPGLAEAIQAQSFNGGWKGEVLHLRKDGTEFPAFLSTNTIRDEAGQVTGVFGLAHDITERKRAEATLRLQSAALASAASGIVITDRKGTIVWVNPAFVQLTGYAEQEAIGRNPRELVRSGVQDRMFYRALWNTILSGQVWHGEIINRRKDGTLYTEEMTITPVRDETGEITHFIAIKQDITERKRAEEELRRAKEVAEAANRAKSEFLANMSHEIRTPMNGIIGMTELALDTDLSPEQREFLGLVKTSADSLLSLLNDILDFSKIEAGKLQFDPVPFSLRETLANTMKSLALRAHQKGLELVCYVHSSVPEALIGDPVRLRQVLVNLVGNAIKFTEYGEVIVEVTSVARRPLSVVGRSERDENHRGAQLTDHSQWCELHFSITDTGIGIPPEKQHLIFDSFTQADGSTTRKYGGTGLGLAISRRLVELMHGRIWVESPIHGRMRSANCPAGEANPAMQIMDGSDNPKSAIRNPKSGGPGSTFHFTAQFQLQQASTTDSAEMDQVDLRGLPALIVDDNATNRCLLSEMLSRWHMKPTTVEDGWTALTVMKQAVAAGEPYPLVLLDAMMPEMDGFMVADQIKHIPELAEAIIMMLTSSDQPEEAARCRELGIAAHLIKPIDPSELFNAIITVLSTAPAELRRPRADRERPESESASARASFAIGRSLRILLAEDNVVNQKVAVRILERGGHQVTVVNHGREALQALERGSFDLVLMDVQMPEMDGLEATQLIRQREMELAKSALRNPKAEIGHIPIIAMTAHAMKGDRERCLAAGMDDYIPKPVQPHELFEIIGRVVPGSTGAAEPVERNNGSGVLNRAALMTRVDGDLELLRELVQLFLADYPKQLSELRRAISESDNQALVQAAHSLKGSVSNFAAKAAYEMAQRLETMGRANELDSADGRARAKEACAALEAEIVRLEAVLFDLVGEQVG